MIQYFYLYLIVIFSNLLYQLYVEFNMDSKFDYTYFNSFYASIFLSTILYTITFFLIFIIHLLLVKFFKLSGLNCYLISLIVGVISLLIFFTKHLGRDLIVTLFSNSTFIIFYVVVLIFLIFKFFKVSGIFE